MNAQRYDAVANALPAELPAINRRQAQRIANAALRKFWPKGCGAPHLYSEHRVRRVWISTKPTGATNSDKGVGRIIHDVSHDVFEAHYPHKRPHDPLHVQHEADMARFVAERLPAWVRPPAPVRKLTGSERRSRQLISTVAAIKRWESKAKRAATALRKLRAKERRLERAMYEHDLRPLTRNGVPTW